MKIVFNTDQIHLHGGIEKVMATKANYFANLPNTEVVVLTVEQKAKSPCYALDARIKLLDLGVNYNRSKSYFSGENVMKAFKHFFKQKKMIKALNPDFIISPNFNFDHYWLPFIKPKKSKLIKEIHASGYLKEAEQRKDSFINNVKQYFEYAVMSRYQGIVVLNNDEKRYQTTNNVFVIPNPVEESLHQATLENKLVIAAGRIAPVKAFDQLVEAWQIVHQQKPDWQLHIYGDGYLDTKLKLEKQIQALLLEKVVILKNSVDNIPAMMLEYSIYAMSSVTECFPTVLLEAQSVGLPAVSYDCPNGPRHIINNQQSGILVPNQQPKELASALLNLITDDKRRKQMGLNAKINSTNFVPHKIMLQWLDMFKDLNTLKA